MIKQNSIVERARLCTALFWLATCLITSDSFADDTPPGTQSQIAVAISVDLQGLGESAMLLQQSAHQLAERINALEIKSDELSPEQLQAMTEMLAQSEQLMHTLNRTLHEIPAAIDAAREPSVAMVSDIFTTAYQRSVEPALHEIDSSVTKWIIIFCIFLLVIAAVAGYGFYRSTRQLRAMAITLKSITNDYEIVRRVRE